MPLAINRTRRRLLHSSSRGLVFVSAFFACSTPRGLSFLPATPQPAGSAQRRWIETSTASAARHHASDGNVAHHGNNVPGSSSSSRARRRRERATMAAARGGGGERQGPGKGTQVVLLRHGMSTFNKLNIFTASALLSSS